MSYSRSGEKESKMPGKIYMAVLLVGCLFVLIVPSLTNVCNVDGPRRKDCGWQGINTVECQGRNCCWNALHSYSYCFYRSDIAEKLKTKTACEHHPPVVLQCNEKNETISIHDVFYGRNNGDNSCHNAGSTTCFNQRATDIVRSICRDNSTCTVTPSGDIWNFKPSCDALNAQLVVHYICILRAVSSSTTTTTTTTVIDTPIPTVSSRTTGQTSLSSEYIASTSVSSTSLSEQSSSPADIVSSIAATESSSLMSPTTKLLEPSSSVVAAQTSSPGTSYVTASLSATTATSIVDVASSKSTAPVSSTIDPGQASQSAMSSIMPYQGSKTMPAVTPLLSITIKQPNSGISVFSSTVSSVTLVGKTSTEASEIESSASETQSSTLPLTPSAMPMHSTAQLSTMSTYSKQATSSTMPTLRTTSVTHVSTSRPSTTSSVPTASPPNETDTNTGDKSKTTYIVIGACVGALIAIICFFLLVRYTKRRLDPKRHAVLSNDVVIASQGTYYGLPMNDLQNGYDNPVQDEEKSGTEAYSNQIYQLNSS